MQLKISHALLLALLSGNGAMAESFGTISADHGGDSRDWFTIRIDTGNATGASATFRAGKMLSNLHMQGHPKPSFTTKDVLSIDASFRSPYKPGAAPMIVEIILMPDGMSRPFWTSDQAPGPAEISFETLDLNSDPGRAVGTFSAVLCMVEELYAEPDLDSCKPISGSFETNIALE
ncbi:hypothetical protein [Oceanibium sediminis]|uniref:hypothetical protein n=1 Tax=Oceanibium sediminis TaxID=2026339 RepID=UPI000DD39983|nr:hypothetical protein [Oceanibium sediminis]